MVLAQSSAERTWLALLWTAWLAASAWVATRSRPSLALAALQVWMAVEVVLPATAAVVDGRTLVGRIDVTAGTVGALRLATTAQVAVVVGAALVRAGRSAAPVRLRPAVASRRLDHWTVGLLVAGLVATVAYVVVAGAPLGSLNALVGAGRYGDLARASDGTTVKYLKVAGGLVGAAMLAATVRLVAGSRIGRWLPVGALAVAVPFLGLRGGRVWLVLPVLACGLLWWKLSRSPWSARPRRVVALGALAVIVLAAVVGGWRAEDRRSIDLGGYLTREVRVGVFASMAALVDAVPAQEPYLGGQSLVEVVALPVPRALWPDKPTGARAEQQAAFLPPSFGASPAFPGELYANAGLAAVALGCLLFGAALEATWLTFATTRRLEVAVVLAAALPVLLQVFSRASVGAQLGGQAGFLAGAAALAWAARRWAPTGPPSPEPAER